MSKKIWRGAGCAVENVTPPYAEPSDCTVVPDAACFPVKEAMAYLNTIDAGHRIADAWAAETAREPDWSEEAVKVDTARAKYLRAVERMKKAKAK